MAFRIQYVPNEEKSYVLLRIRDALRDFLAKIRT